MTILAIIFIIGAVSLLGDAVWHAVTNPEAAAQTGNAIRLICGRALPAVWLATAGGGLLAGRAWARMLVTALAVLAVVVVAGTLAQVGRSPDAAMGVGTALTMLAVTGGGALYLSSDRVKAWLR